MKNKQLLIYSKNPQKSNIKQHISNSSDGLGELNSKQDDTNLKSDINCEMSKPFLGEFCYTNNLDCILNKLTCNKNPKNTSSIEMVLTNK